MARTRLVSRRRSGFVPFRERNPVVIGAVGLGVIAAMLLLAFNIDDVPLLAGRSYSAALSEAGGLKAGDDVRVAGVKVGKVRSVDLEGDHVRVDFRVSGDTRLGSETAASVRIKTILGQKFLMLEPAGRGELDGEIPLDRTVPALAKIDSRDYRQMV
jgi:phospholipid/cholesterol/gamma-HCH transport system substrate-binding protein